MIDFVPCLFFHRFVCNLSVFKPSVTHTQTDKKEISHFFVSSAHFFGRDPLALTSFFTIIKPCQPLNFQVLVILLVFRFTIWTHVLFLSVFSVYFFVLNVCVCSQIKCRPTSCLQYCHHRNYNQYTLAFGRHTTLIVALLDCRCNRCQHLYPLPDSNPDKSIVLCQLVAVLVQTE